MDIFENIKMLTGKKPIPGTQKPSPRTILIVEDEKPLLNILTDRFQKEGFSVLGASNGQEGIDLLSSNKPDILLLDLLMPVMDGKTMLRKLREMPGFEKLPVIVLTNAGEVENIRQTKTYNNAVAFLIKSNVTMDQIVEGVRLVTG